jgi:ABC-type multidrug transport system ATPase subunit
MEEVERLCGRVLLLSKGGIILQGTPEELASRSEGKGLRDLVLGLQEDAVE